MTYLKATRDHFLLAVDISNSLPHSCL